MAKDAVSLLGNFQDNIFHGGLPFAVYDNLAEIYTNLSLAAGQLALDMFTVPAGEVWVMTNLVWQYAGTVPSFVWIALYRAPTPYYLFPTNGLTSGLGYRFAGTTVLVPGDIIRVVMGACTLNDDFTCWIHGYKMRVKA